MRITEFCSLFVHIFTFWQYINLHFVSRYRFFCSRNSFLMSLLRYLHQPKWNQMAAVIFREYSRPEFFWNNYFYFASDTLYYFTLLKFHVNHYKWLIFFGICIWIILKLLESQYLLKKYHADAEILQFVWHM